MSGGEDRIPSAMRLARYVIWACAAALIAAFAVHRFLPGAPAPSAPSLAAMVGTSVPELDLPALDPAKPGLDTRRLGGQVMLLSMFASWCVPCREEHPVLMQLAAGGRLKIAGIDYADKPDKALAWLKANGDPFAVIGADANGDSARKLGIEGIPDSFLIDRDGRIRFAQAGPLTPAIARDKLLPLVAELTR